MLCSCSIAGSARSAPASTGASSQPYSQRIFDAVKETGAPAIHFGTGAASLLEVMTEAGGDIISVDWRVDLDEAWARIGYERGIQGNLDPTLLLTPWEIIEEGCTMCCAARPTVPAISSTSAMACWPRLRPTMLRRLVEAVHEEHTEMGVTYDEHRRISACC